MFLRKSSQRSPIYRQAAEVQVMDVLASFCFLGRSKWDASGWWKMRKLANHIWHFLWHTVQFFTFFRRNLDSLHGSDSLGNHRVTSCQSSDSCHQGAPRWRFLGSRANPPGDANTLWITLEHVFNKAWNKYPLKQSQSTNNQWKKQPIVMFLWTLGQSISQCWWDYNLCRLPIPFFFAGIPKRISESGFPLLSQFSLVTSK